MIDTHLNPVLGAASGAVLEEPDLFGAASGELLEALDQSAEDSTDAQSAPIDGARLEEKIEYAKAFRKRYLQQGLVVTEVPADVFNPAVWLRLFERRRLAASAGARHNSMHKFSLSCSEEFAVGAEAGDRLLTWVQAMVATYFNDIGSELQLFTAFAIWYKHDEGSANSTLCQHQDDSDLTVNLALRSDQDGCKVRFEGAQHLTQPLPRGGGGVPGAYSPYTEVDLPPGYALLHRGRHPHDVTPIEAGERWSLILWYKRRRGVAGA